MIDASTSMLRFTSGGRTKLAAALDAAGQLVDMLAFDQGDAAAIVAFNDETWTEEMSGDRDVVVAALGRIPGVVQEGTRLDLAINAGGLAHRILPARLGDAREVVILLTDGLPNRVPFGPGSSFPECGDQECSTVKVAQAVKTLGIEIHAIGLGDVLDRLMVRIPNDPADYHYAPDGEDLAAIYRQIAAGLVECGAPLSKALAKDLAKTGPSAPAWTVETVGLADTSPGQRIIIGGDRAPTAGELQSIALYNRGHTVADPILERAGYGLVWTPGRTHERLDYRGSLDLQGSGVSAWREEVGTLTGPMGDAQKSNAARIRLRGAALIGKDQDSIAQAGPFAPTDPRFPDQWALRGMYGLQWAAAWLGLTNLGDGGASGIIAIIDNGLECAHPDLNCHVGTHYNATRDNEREHRSPWDTEVLVQGTGYDHGTFVAGIASAHIDNGYGVAGISNAAVVDTQGCIGGGCAESDVIRALAWIGEQADAGLPIQAVNMSFAFKTSRLCDPISAVRDRGIMPFAAVGNSGDRTTGTRPQHPAACPDAVGIVHVQEDGTIDPQGQRAAVSLSAPGSEVASLCARPHTTGTGSGSSFASPAGAASYVAVRAALEPALGPVLAPEAALEVLYQTADPIEPATHPRGSADPGRDGYGRINLERALADIEGEWIGQGIPTPGATPTPVGTPTPTPCVDEPARCAAIGTATAIAAGTPTPTDPPASPTIDPTVAAILTGTPVPSVTPSPTIDPTVAALLTAAVTPSATPTIDPTEVARWLTEIAPSPTPDKVATAHHLRCFVIDRCAPELYLPRLTR